MCLKYNLFLFCFLFQSSILFGQYCASNATNGNASKIDNVRLVGESVTINQNSVGPCETYTDNTMLPAADLLIGGSYTVEITLGTCTNDRNKSANVYIDFNQDNDFNDPGEDLGNTGVTTTTGTLTINFTVDGCPQPPTGLTRMRIVAVQGTGAIAACGTYTRGETEDYSVRIIAPTTGSVFYLVGDAVSNAGNCIQLTSTTNGQLGMAWDISSPLNFALPFTYDFVVNLGNNDAGADGLMFIIQNDPNLQCVIPSGGWGAGNISNSLSVEIDTYLNTEDRDDGLPGVVCTGVGTEPDHLDIWLDGNINPLGVCGTTPGARIIPTAVPLLDGGVDYNVENGLDHVFRVSWIPGLPGTFTATLLDATGITSYGSVSYSFDPLAVFGTNTPIYGFSGSTGGLNNEHVFCPTTILLNEDLINFEAKLNTNGETDLEWITTATSDYDYFVVEKSRTYNDFEEVLKIENQEVNTASYYSHREVDPNPFIGISYYRLKIIKLDGSILYSDLRAVERKAKDYHVNVYPNPTDGLVTIELRENKQATILLTNALGQQIIVESKKEGNNEMILDLSDIAIGVYWLQIKINKESNKVIKLIKK